MDLTVILPEEEAEVFLAPMDVPSFMELVRRVLKNT